GPLLSEPDDRIERSAQLMTHIGEKHRFGSVCVGQLDCSLLDSALQCRIKFAQLVLRTFLCGVTGREGISHGVECRSEMADLRLGTSHLDACVVIAVAPLSGKVQQAAAW